MRKFSLIFLCISLLTLAASCDFRPLAKVGNTHYVRVYIDERIPKDSTIPNMTVPHIAVPK